MINISGRRECFFDDYLIDTEKTTASFLLHSPTRKELVMEFNMPWEGDGSTSQCMFRDGDIYRLYYIGRDMSNENPNGSKTYYFCYAESRDGLNWIRPSLNMFEFDGSTDNNIINSRQDSGHGPLFVFKDTNPNCSENARYKALVCYSIPYQGESLYALPSADGIHFDYENKILIEKGGHYDSLHACFWDERVGKYRCYFRGQHLPPDYDGPAISTHDRRSYGVRVRDIRYKESEDFLKWGDSCPITFDDGDLCLPMYENKIVSYFRAPHMQIGFPTRYIERKVWTENYDELTDCDHRKKRYETDKRFGLAITDCTFIASHNGRHFKRYAEAFIRPGRENGRNWLYGGPSYPSYGIFETPCEDKNEGTEISMYAPDEEWHGIPTKLYRYTIRLDGFASLHADGKQEELIVSKPFVFEGDNLFANISTSARGYMYFTLESTDGLSISSCETFGDAPDRKIRFTNGAVADFSGKEVVLKIRIFDADIYSIHFSKDEK